MTVSAYASPLEKGWYYLHRLIGGAVLLFLIAPVLVALLFNSHIPRRRWRSESAGRTSPGARQ